MYISPLLKFVLLVVALCLNQCLHAQKEGDAKKVMVEYRKLDPQTGIMYFIDKVTKDTFEYDIFYMMREQPKEYQKVEKAITQAYNYCIAAYKSCDFYGQTYTADVVFSPSYKKATGSAKESFSWKILGLQRDLSNSVPALVYVPDYEKYNHIYLVIGDQQHELEYLGGDLEYKRWGGSGFISMLTAEDSYGNLEKFSFKLSEHSGLYNDTYYRLESRRSEDGELMSIITTDYDVKGNRIKDKFNTGYSKEATIKYLNEKFSAVNGLKVGTEWNVFSEKNSISISKDQISYYRSWGIDPSSKKCSDSKYKSVSHELYNFNPAGIRDIVKGGDEEEKPTGYFRILFNDESVKKTEYENTCEEAGNTYQWVETERERTYIKSMVVYFVSSEPENFEQIKRALLHLKNFYK